MARFKQKNLKLKNNQRIYLGTNDEVSIWFDGDELQIDTTISGVAPTEDYHLSTKKYVDDEITTISGAIQDTSETEKFTLDATDISNKYIDLSYTPVSNDRILIFVIGGIKGELDVDYSVSNKRISWDGKDWDGLLEAGDKFSILYWY